MTGFLMSVKPPTHILSNMKVAYTVILILCCAHLSLTVTVGNPCSLGQDCHEYNAICSGSICACKPGTEYVHYFIYAFCQKVLELGEHCLVPRKKCKTPNSACLLNTAKGIFECQCLPPYIAKNKECVYPNGQLGTTCTSSIECAVAYSECSATTKKCVCIEGFTAKGSDTCIKPAPICPSGQSSTTKPTCKRNRVATVSCSLIKSNTKGQTYFICAEASGHSSCHQFTDDCPQGYYCAPYEVVSFVNEQEGVCCKHAEPKCPFGVPHGSSVAPNYGCNGCPISTTHYCHLDGVIVRTPICCKRPCNTPGSVYANGACYMQKDIGDECEIDVQCQRKTTGTNCIASNGKKQCHCTNIGHIALNRKCSEPVCKGGTPLKGQHQRIVRCRTNGGPSISNNDVLVAECPSGYDCDINYGICCPPYVSRDCSLIVDLNFVDAYLQGSASIAPICDSLNTSSYCTIFDGTSPEYSGSGCSNRVALTKDTPNGNCILRVVDGDMLLHCSNGILVADGKWLNELSSEDDNGTASITNVKSLRCAKYNHKMKYSFECP